MLKSKQTHPNAEAYRSRKFQREAIRQLYAIIVPSLVPRDQFIGYSGLLTSCVYSAPHVACVTAALKIIPQVLSDVSPANAARRLIALKNDNDDSFDVVEAVTKNPKLLLKTPKPRGDDPEDLTAQAGTQCKGRSECDESRHGETHRAGSGRRRRETGKETNRGFKIQSRRNFERHQHTGWGFVRSVLEPLGGFFAMSQSRHGKP